MWGGNPETERDPTGHLRTLGSGSGNDDDIEIDYTHYHYYLHRLYLPVHIADGNKDVTLYGPDTDYTTLAQAIIKAQGDTGGPGPGQPTWGGGLLYIGSEGLGIVPWNTGAVRSGGFHVEPTAISQVAGYIRKYQQNNGFFATYRAHYNVNIFVTWPPCSNCQQVAKNGYWMKPLVDAVGPGMDAQIILKVWVIEPDPLHPDQSQIRLWGTQEAQTSDSRQDAALWVSQFFILPTE